jgi:hypothetical protein
MLSLLQYKQKIKMLHKTIQNYTGKKQNLIKDHDENPEHAMDY